MALFVSVHLSRLGRAFVKRSRSPNLLPLIRTKTIHWASRVRGIVPDMLSRRDFIASALAIGSLGVSPALAHRRGSILPVEVKLRTKLAPGEIHVDPNAFNLYWTLPGNRAIRYAVGVGRKRLYQSGTFFIA